MRLHVDKNDNDVVIHLHNKFDFSGADDFKNAYEEYDGDNYIIDFRDTDYMDSSGLGMLLNMKRNLPGKPISLINCKAQIKKILIISRFEEQFTIQ